MLFSRATLLALLSAPLLALAAMPNPFKVPVGFSATAGQALDLEWTPTTQGTVSLVLRTGASSDLAAGMIIASGIPNSGAFQWTPPTSIVRGSDYTVEIVDDADPSQMNYTPYFVIDSTNTVATTLSQVSLGAPSSVLQTVTASPTGSATSVLSASTQSASASGSASSSSGASSGSASTTASSGSGSASAASATSPTSVGIQTTASNAAPRATAMAGMLGMVALGALAL